MPPANPATVSAAVAADIVAYILQANGATPGAQPLAPATSVRIGTVSMQQAVAAPAATPAAVPAAPATQALLPTGLTVRGEVIDYTPVTDNMLRNPPPGDWLMVRRTYQGWSHSPLRQVTRDNVKNLRLA